MDTWKTNWENWHLKDPGEPATRFVSMGTPWRRSEDWSFSCERWTDASAPRWGWAWGGNSRAPAIWLRVPMGYLWGTYGVPSVVSHTVAVIAISHISPPCRIQHVSHGKTHGKKHQRVRWNWPWSCCCSEPCQETWVEPQAWKWYTLIF